MGTQEGFPWRSWVVYAGMGTLAVSSLLQSRLLPVATFGQSTKRGVESSLPTISRTDRSSGIRCAIGIRVNLPDGMFASRCFAGRESGAPAPGLPLLSGPALSQHDPRRHLWRPHTSPGSRSSGGCVAVGRAERLCLQPSLLPPKRASQKQLGLMSSRRHQLFPGATLWERHHKWVGGHRGSQGPAGMPHIVCCGLRVKSSMDKNSTLARLQKAVMRISRGVLTWIAGAGATLPFRLLLGPCRGHRRLPTPWPREKGSDFVWRKAVPYGTTLRVSVPSIQERASC